MKKLIKIKESELLMLLENQLTHPDKYDKRKELISALKSAEYTLKGTVKKIDDAYGNSKDLPDEEMGVTTKLNKCYTELRKELTQIRDILAEVTEGDHQPSQIQDTEPESLQQENSSV